MRREAQHIGADLGDVDGALARGLHGVAVKQRAVRAGQTGDLGDRLHHPGLVVRQHHRHERRHLGACELGVEGSEVDHAVATGDGYHGGVGRGMQHRVVLDRRDDASRSPAALEGEVVRLGAAAGQHDILGSRPDERSDTGTCFVRRTSGDAPEAVHRRGIAGAAQPFGHRFDDGRLRRGAGVVVKVAGRSRHRTTWSSSGRLRPPPDGNNRLLPSTRRARTSSSETELRKR